LGVNEEIIAMKLLCFY